ncbi:MAG: hypothetical protein QM539_10560 [Alphaproteobacteria bacterium]|nr:hypothetical protein [Alphaproteobacteria bacterium]
MGSLRVIILFFFTIKCNAQSYAYEIKNKFDSIQNKNILISTKPAIELNQVNSYSNLFRYKKDSIWNRGFYHKIIEDSKRKPEIIVLPIGICISGGFTYLANKISGKTRKYKKFLKQIETDEKESFIQIFYNSNRVKEVVCTSDSIATAFIQAKPIPYDFLRVASPLEINMWIRENYKIFITTIRTNFQEE